MMRPYIQGGISFNTTQTEVIYGCLIRSLIAEVCAQIYNKKMSFDRLFESCLQLCSGLRDDGELDAPICVNKLITNDRSQTIVH